MHNLLATGITSGDILDSIKRFYCGSPKVLIPTGKDRWLVGNPTTGTALDGVHVIRAKGRYRFEMTEDQHG